MTKSWFPIEAAFIDLGGKSVFRDSQFVAKETDFVLLVSGMYGYYVEKSGFGFCVSDVLDPFD